MQPLVSIIIPVHNAEKYLAGSITSALTQTWPDKEIIVVNNGSTDNSLQIAKSFEGSAVKVFSQENKGAASARNTGLREAKGKYIQFLDADDLLSPDKVKEQVILLEQNPGKLAICSMIHFYGDADLTSLLPSPYEEAFLFDDEDPVHFLISLWGGYTPNGGMVSVHSWLTLKSVIDAAGGWDESLSLDDDGEFFSRVVLNSKGIIKTKGYVYYRKYASDKSLSSVTNKSTAASRLQAALSKKGHLLSVNNSYEAKAAVYKMLVNIAADNYLNDRQICNAAIAELPDIRINYRPPMGGAVSEALSAVLGWRNVKLLKNLFLHK